IDSEPSNPTNSTSAMFGFSASDPTVGGVSSGVNHLETRLDAASFATATSPQTLSALGEGHHTFQVRALDNAGDVESTATFSWDIDLTVPTASITSTPANPTNTTSASFSFSGADPTSNGVSSGVNHLETKLDGGSFATATSSQTFTSLSEGHHTFQVRPVDNAGNTGSAASGRASGDVT